LDTRTKIVAPEQAGSRTAQTFLRGYFDPLLAAHAKIIGQLPGPVAVLLADPPDPLLPARSRAELVAALRGVSYVVLPLDDGSAFTPPNVDIVDELSADLERRQSLVSHVHRRHR
jgi:hypothetical protein